MAVTEQDVQVAYNAVAAAEVQIAQAELALQAARPFTPAHEQAKAAVDAAKGAHSRARARYVQVSNDYNKQNPTKKAPTVAEADAKAKAEQRARNKASMGAELTDAERIAHEDRNRPNKPRVDSPVQVATANNTAARDAETARANRQRETQTGIKTQQDALVASGTLFNNLRDQISREAAQRAEMGNKGITQVREAATTLVGAAVSQRDQDVRIRNERSAFVRDVLTTAMPQVVQLMLKTPKGSPVAANFLKAMLVMANDAYKNARLNEEPPPIGPNTPGFNTLMQINGYKLPEQIPTMPSSNQVNADTAQAAAAGSFPLVGHQGPLGAGAIAMPSPNVDGGSSGPRNGNGIDPIAEAGQSQEGIAIRDNIQAPIRHILQRDPSTWTPEERTLVSESRKQYEAQLKELAAKRQAQAPPGVAPGAAQPNEAQALKDKVREVLISGDPNQRLQFLALARTALANRDAGKPLSPDEVEMLANLDPGDLPIIEQNMNPQVMDIITRHSQGQPITEEEKKIVENSVLTTSTAIKTRPIVPPQPEVRPPVDATPEAQPTVTGKVGIDNMGRKFELPSHIPDDAPPFDAQGSVDSDMVLVQRPDGSKYWQARNAVQATDNVIADPKKPPQAAIPKLMGPEPHDDAMGITQDNRASMAAEFARKRAVAGTDMPIEFNQMYTQPGKRFTTPPPDYELPTDWQERISSMTNPLSGPPEPMTRTDYFTRPPMELSEPEPEPIDIPLFDPSSFFARRRDEDEDEDRWW